MRGGSFSRGEGQGSGTGYEQAGASAGPLLPQTPRPTLVAPRFPTQFLGSSMSRARLRPAAPPLQLPTPAEPRSSGVPQQQVHLPGHDRVLPWMLSAQEGRRHAGPHRLRGRESLLRSRTRVGEEPSFHCWSAAGLGVRVFNGEPEGQKEAPGQDLGGAVYPSAVHSPVNTPAARRLS